MGIPKKYQPLAFWMENDHVCRLGWGCIPIYNCQGPILQLHHTLMNQTCQGFCQSSPVSGVITLDLLGHDAWEKFQKYPPRWWFHGVLLMVKSKKSPETNPSETNPITHLISKCYNEFHKKHQHGSSNSWRRSFLQSMFKKNKPVGPHLREKWSSLIYVICCSFGYH